MTLYHATRKSSNGMEVRRSQKHAGSEPLRVVDEPRVSSLDYLPRESWWCRTDRPFSELCRAEQARMEKSPLGKNTTLSYEAYSPDRSKPVATESQPRERQRGIMAGM